MVANDSLSISGFLGCHDKNAMPINIRVVFIAFYLSSLLVYVLELSEVKRQC